MSDEEDEDENNGSGDDNDIMKELFGNMEIKEKMYEECECQVNFYNLPE